MAIIEDSNLNFSLKNSPTPNGNLETSSITTDSKAADFFEYLYSYPPKFTIKWDAIDEFKEDLFLDYNYGVLEHSFPFIDFIEDWFFNDTPEEAVSDDYAIKNYIDGYLDKVNSSKFYKNGTKSIQNALANIPVFVILNGRNEIVLANPSINLGVKTFPAYVKKVIYNSAGAFDQNLDNVNKLGLFFMSRADAETYLQTIAQTDIKGTKTVGLSVHCIGLDSVYRITREHHPGIDFRYVPNFTDVKELLDKHIGKSDIIVEDGQQQLRFRRRGATLFPFLGKIGEKLSLNSSFLQRNEYFKGVPIFVVQISTTPKNILVDQYYNILGVIDTAWARFIQGIDHTMGFGHNWIMQGSLDDAGKSDNLINFVFFEKTQAENFVKAQGRSVARYSGSRTSNLEFLVRKPKIYLYNLEDFIETWEDALKDDFVLGSNDAPNSIFNTKNTYFITPKNNEHEVLKFKENAKTVPLKGVKDALGLKFRILKNFIGILFNTN